MRSTEQLHGVWQALAATVSGDAIPPSTVESIRLTLTATRFTTQRGSETLFDSSYTIDPNASPMHIEMVGVGDFQGQPALGIFRLEGDALLLCYKMPGGARPTEFSSPPGSGAFLISLRRLPAASS